MNQHYASTKKTNIFPKRLLLVLAIILMGLPAMRAQSVIMNGGYFLTHGNNELSVSTALVSDFNPNTCIWYINNRRIQAANEAGTAYTGNSYLRTGSISLGGSVQWRTAGANNSNLEATRNNYLNRNGTTAWRISNTNNNAATTYTVTIGTPQEAVLTDITINSGADVISATGNYTYGHTNASYTPAYTNYIFSNTNHYIGVNNNTLANVNPTTITTGYIWTLSGNAADYATLVGNELQVTGIPDFDITLTLTITLTYEGITKTATKEITIQGTYPSAPAISVSGTTVTLSTTAAGTTTIRYTLNGTTPTATSGIVYDGTPLDFSSSATSPITIKAVTVRGGVASPVAEQEVTLTLPTPVITIDPNAGTATIACDNASATVYYTTNGTEPSPSNGTVYTSTITGLTIMQKVKAMAILDGWNNSAVASATVSIPSSVSGGTVILNDLEDHNWSYYQPMYDIYDNYPRRMCSPYPRNVKITYYGYGNNTLSLSEEAAPATNTFTTNTTSSQVKVGIGEDGNTFIYYKTLERDANNRFPYELIPNPFYVRPKSGTTYTGFYKWRIKSITSGAIYDSSSGGTALGIGSLLDAETTYYFQPTDNARTNANNATSMEIELEALWAPAEISTGNTPSFSMGYNSVERNFYVGSGGLFSSTTPCTYSSFYPNGTTDGTASPTIATDGTVNGRQTKASGTATADCKVEYMLLTGNTTADAYNLTLGRGIGIGTAGYFYPVNATKNVDLDFRLRIESGVYSRLYLMSEGTRSYQRIQNHFTIGSDYDRAKGDNSKLIVAQENIIKNGNSEFSDANKDKPTLTCIIKSGEFQSNYWYNNNNAQYNYGFYSCQDHDNASYPGLTTLIVEGGHFASIIGGRGNYTVGCITQDSLAFDLRFKGGLVENSIYGASSNNQTYGSRRLIFTGGEVRGWIAAGCNGTSSDNNGQTNGDSYVYVGGNTKVGNADYPRTNNSAEGGNVFGAGRGMASQRAFIKTSHVAVADNAEVLYNVFGGGFHGYITTTSNIFILGGTTHGKVFGGGDNHGDVNATVTRRIPTVNINMIGGVVEGGVYGGSNTTGIVTDQVTLKINGGQVGTTSANATINGGGYGNETRVNGNVDVTLGEINQTGDGVTVYGDVYGGSALGLVNGTAVTTAYHTNVTLNKGVINGSLYGGGLGETGTAANVYGPVQVTVNGGSVNTTSASGSGAVYGCNNIYGAPQSTVNVDIYGTDPASTPGQYALDAVYGGGNQADYSGTPVVKVHNCDNSIGYVYGGGNAAAVAATNVTIYGGNSIGTVFGGGNGTVTAANVTNNTVANIYGGTIGQVFGGSNSQGNIGGTITVNVDKQADTDPNGSSTACDMKVGEVYGGGNMAASKAGNISINCTGDFVTGSNGHDNCNSTTNRIGYELEGIGAVYGGANAAKVTGNITLNITGGMIYRVFGGNNTSNTVDGEIVVNINKTQTCGWYVGYVYGGGNNAPYTRTGEAFPKVNILAGNVSHDVFGAGKGTDAAVTGNPVVTLTGSSEVGGNVYGGGDQGAVTGETKVEIKDAN